MVQIDRTGPIFDRLLSQLNCTNIDINSIDLIALKEGNPILILGIITWAFCDFSQIVFKYFISKGILFNPSDKERHFRNIARVAREELLVNCQLSDRTWFRNVNKEQKLTWLLNIIIKVKKLEQRLLKEQDRLRRAKNITPAEQALKSSLLSKQHKYISSINEYDTQRLLKAIKKYISGEELTSNELKEVKKLSIKEFEDLIEEDRREKRFLNKANITTKESQYQRDFFNNKSTNNGDLEPSDNLLDNELDKLDYSELFTNIKPVKLSKPKPNKNKSLVNGITIPILNITNTVKLQKKSSIITKKLSLDSSDKQENNHIEYDPSVEVDVSILRNKLCSTMTKIRSGIIDDMLNENKMVELNLLEDDNIYTNNSVEKNVGVNSIIPHLNETDNIKQTEKCGIDYARKVSEALEIQRKAIDDSLRRIHRAKYNTSISGIL